MSILINRKTGIRTGAEVNERPVDVQSRALTEAAAESESPMLHQSKRIPIRVSALILGKGDSNGRGSE